MPDTTTGPLEDELRHIAQALVAEAPDVPDFTDLTDFADLTDDAGSGASFGRRHAMAIGGVAAAVTLALVGAVAVVADGGDDDSATVLAADAGLEPAPQHLVLGGVSELRPDGELVDLQVDGLDGLFTAEPAVAFRADGSYVVVGFEPVDPQPEDFNDLPFALRVVGADGEVEVERRVEQARLLGVTDDEAILYREPVDATAHNYTGPATIVAHDLATGVERSLGPANAEPESWRVYRGASVVGDELVAIAPGGQVDSDYPRPVMPSGPPTEEEERDREHCTLRRLDLTTGEETETPLDSGCSARAMRVSPDGSRAAVTYTATVPLETDEAVSVPAEDHVAVIDLDDDTVVYDERVADVLDCPATPSSCPPEMPYFLTVRGMAWMDGTTLRVVAGGDGDHDTLGELAVGDLSIP